MGTVLGIVGCALLQGISTSEEVSPATYGYETLIGLCLGLIFSTTTVVARLQALPEDAASAQGLLGQTRILGGNIGLAIATVVLNAGLSADLKGVLTEAQINRLRRSLNEVNSFNPQQIHQVGIAFAKAFRIELIICATLTAAAFVAVLCSYENHPPTFDAILQQQVQEKQQIEADAICHMGHDVDLAERRAVSPTDGGR